MKTAVAGAGKLHGELPKLTNFTTRGIGKIRAKPKIEKLLYAASTIREASKES